MKIYKQTIAANAYHEISAVGNYVGIIGPTSARARIRTDRGLDVELEQGQHVRNIERFDSVRVYNLENFPMALEISIGLGEIVDNQLRGSVVVTPGAVYRPLPAVTLTGGVDNLALIEGDRSELHLKCPVTNTGEVWLGGVADEGIPLSPGDTLIMEFSGVMTALGALGDKVYVAEVLA